MIYLLLFTINAKLDLRYYDLGRQNYNLNMNQVNLTVAYFLRKASPMQHILYTQQRLPQKKYRNQHQVQNQQANQPTNNQLQKRFFSHTATSVGAAIGMSGPGFVGMVQAFHTPNMTAQDRSDMFLKSTFDVAANILMFAGGLPGVALGGAWMITNTFFDAFEGSHGPPAVDPNALFSQIQDYISMVIPSPDEMFMQIRQYLDSFVDSSIDARLLKVYQDNTQQALRIISQYLNNYDGETNVQTILSNWKSLVAETATEMIRIKMPLSVDDNLDNVETYELGTMIAIYPQFVSMLLLALKEWYVTAQHLKQPVTEIQNKYDAYVAAFSKHFELMVNKWYTDTKTYILQSTVERTDSASCLLTMKYPGVKDQTGYVQQTDAEPKYNFNNSTATPVERVDDAKGRDFSQKYVTLIEMTPDRNGKRVCDYEKKYKTICKKPCSKTKQAFSYVFPVFGVANTKCFSNTEKCTYTQIGLQIQESTCKVSNCSIQFNEARQKLLEQLDETAGKARQTVVRYNYLLQNATITDESSFMENLDAAKSMALQEFIPKDEVFNGDVCHGLLATPKINGIPKMCIVDQKMVYGCPTANKATVQYILYPDILRSQLNKLCPGYIRPAKDNISKAGMEKLTGFKMTDEQFAAVKAAHEQKQNIDNPKGVNPRSIAQNGDSVTSNIPANGSAESLSTTNQLVSNSQAQNAPSAISDNTQLSNSQVENRQLTPNVQSTQESQTIPSQTQPNLSTAKPQVQERIPNQNLPNSQSGNTQSKPNPQNAQIAQTANTSNAPKLQNSMLGDPNSSQ
eukprot:NODE_148_length_15570_cov_0.950100.p1 type:complete len:796 gc:universal NODE_148_length_15570_cov_0.950100:12395-10008(-)